MTETSLAATLEAVPPGFAFNPESMDTYDEQLATAQKQAEYQAAPPPSFEGVPMADIVPTFNPTGAPTGEVYAHGRAPESMRKLGIRPRSEWPDVPDKVVMWRIVEREKLVDGSGLVSSRVLRSDSLGDVEGFDSKQHYASTHHERVADPDAATPFVSFSTDPEYLARELILARGFGVKGGRESVVVRVSVDPDRMLTGNKNKSEEVLLIGGVAPDEYDGAYSMADFVSAVIPEGEMVGVSGNKVLPAQALGHWALQTQGDVWSEPK
jgi:hypothetical protein